jgi:hypothetical protein
MPDEFRNFNTFGNNTFEYYDSLWEQRLQQDIAKLLLRPDLKTSKKGQETIAKKNIQIYKGHIESATTAARMGKQAIVDGKNKILDKWNEKVQPTIDSFTPDTVRDTARRAVGVATNVASIVAEGTARAAEHVEEAEYIPYLLMFVLMMSMFTLGYKHIEL